MPTRNANPTEFLAWRWIRAMLGKCQVAAFDGRPLYQYKLSHEEVVDLQALLTESFKRTLPEIPRSLGAAFCLWAAHWFQQEFHTAGEAVRGWFGGGAGGGFGPGEGTASGGHGATRRGRFGHGGAGASGRGGGGGGKGPVTEGGTFDKKAPDVMNKLMANTI
jgi:hypothetical protein